ncbi:MAG: aminoacyl-tRNA hydrolase [candidate division WOR-3 bacterium]|jgi:PTH1 family peptidyl-tRNA hydrolase
MLYIVGLGNYGEIYKKNRHNVGWIFLDYLSNKLNCNFRAGKGDYAMADCGEFKLFKPLTFMNLSGIAVKQIYDYYKISLEKLIIVYDDADLPLGTLRFKLKGSAGSHNGMKSVIYYLNTEEIPRIRIGIGRPENISLKNWVLSDFKEEEIKILEEKFEKIYLALLLYNNGDVQKAIQLLNTKEVKI